MLETILERIANALERQNELTAKALGAAPAAAAASAAKPGKTKAEKPAAPAVEAAPEDVFGGEEPAAPAAPVYTAEIVSGYFRKAMDQKKLDVPAAKAILAKYKVGKVADVKPADYAAVVGELKALLGEK